MFDYFSRFFYILSGKKKQLVFLICLFLITSILESFGIGLIGPFIALATNPKFIYQNHLVNEVYTKLAFHSEGEFITLVGLLILGILYFKALLSFNVQRSIFKFGFELQADLRSRLMHAYLAAPYTFHLNQNSAVSIQNIVSETSKFANGILMPILFSTSNVAIVCSLLLLLCVTDLVATISILIVILTAFSLIYWFKDKIALWGREGTEADIAMIRTINHGLGGLKETRIIGCESYFEKHIAEQAEKFKSTITAFNSFSLLPRYMVETLLFTFIVGFTLTTLLLKQNTQSITATLGVFGMASIRLLPAVSSSLQAFGNIRNTSYVVDKLYLVLKELEQVESSNKLSTSGELVVTNPSHEAMSFEDKIILDKVTYRYPHGSEAALNDISLVINKGKSIGLIGKSGAGKTTLVDVILGLLIPDSGDIKVDGISIVHNIRHWQNLIGYIPQSIFLIDDTIERNIAFGVFDDLIDQQRLDKAIEAAQLTDLVNQLPNGLKTVVGERGTRLSGGQRQRVGIARALYHEREILVLDEATAALDNDTERLVSEAIKSLSGKKTLVIIAHRLSTIEHCDQVYLMEKGQVVKSGSYKEVVLGEQPLR